MGRTFTLTQAGGDFKKVLRNRPDGAGHNFEHPWSGRNQRHLLTLGPRWPGPRAMHAAASCPLLLAYSAHLSLLLPVPHPSVASAASSTIWSI